MSRQPERAARSYSLADHAKAFAVILGEEFDESFTFQDAKTGASVRWDDGADCDELLPPSRITQIAVTGRACVSILDGGGYEVSIPLYTSGQAILVATAMLARIAASGADASKELRRLQKWAQSLCERLRSSDYILSQRRAEEGSQKTVWEAMLSLDHLLRRLRIHKDTTANQRRILETAFGLLGVEALAWVPSEGAQVVFEGRFGLSTADWRHLAVLLAKNPEQPGAGAFIANDLRASSWTGRFPNLVNVMALPVAGHKQPGWVIAVNKKSGSGQVSDSGEITPFRHSDAALLTPFVALLEMQTRTATRYRDLKELLVGLTRSLTATLDAKDPYTCGHSERVARIAVELGRELRMADEEVGNLYLAGLLHDIGNIGINEAVLRKPGSLTAEEYEHLKQHVHIGYSILADLGQIRDLLPGVLYHHERYDGAGYPDGLSGDTIPLLARVLAVADAYDAMSTSRPYRAALTCERVEQILTQGAGKQWDKRVIDAFLRCKQRIHALHQRGVGESLQRALDGALRKSDSASLVLSRSPVQLAG